MRPPNGELVNTATHAVGWLLSVIGAVALMFRVLDSGDTWRIVGCGIFAVSLVVVYAASTLSHWVGSPGPRRWFRMLDQGLIYVLIVGTFTPFSLAFLRTPLWWCFFAILWTIAIAGMLSKLLFAHRVDAVTVRTYMVLGWLPIFPMGSLVTTLPAACLGWVIAGGLCYTLGIVFFMWDDARFRIHSHAIWHVLAIVGSACHFAAIYLFVAGPAS
jgi:hemolysin III